MIRGWFAAAVGVVTMAAAVLVPTGAIATSEGRAGALRPNPAPSPTLPADAPADEPTEDAQPNFVLIVTDDQKWDSIGRCAPALDPYDFDAGEDACMPHLQDLLLDAGTTFLEGQVTQSLCCPSRASILTGQYSTTHGVTNNNGSLLDDSSTIATWLDDAGYRTGLFGKYLNGYGLGPLEGHIPPGWDVIEAFHGYRNSDDPYIDYPWISWREGDDEGVIGRINDADSTSGEACADGNLYSTDYICNVTIDFLQADTSTPFFAYVNPATPHSPYTIAERHIGTFSSIDIPHYPSTNVLPSPNPPSYLPLEDLRDRTLDRIEGTLRKALEQTLTVDDMIGALHADLTADGRIGNTVWIFISDNGTASGEHHWRNKGCEYSTCHRVPFVVVCPTGICDGAQPGSVDASNYVLNIDLAPTIADLAGATPTLTTDGQSLVPLLNDPTAPWRNEWFIHGNNPFYEGVVGIGTDGAWYKYVEFPGPGEYELYNLDDDPWELTNLAGDADHAVIEADLAARLAAHLAGDPPPPNEPPVASFTADCTHLDCTFTDTSTDPDGTITTWEWDFGDTTTSTTQHPTHTYPTADTYTVTLTVTDNDGDTHTTTTDITTTQPPAGDEPFIETDGLVVMEAEHYAATVERSGDAWLETVTIDGYSGDAAMESGPDDGTRIRTDLATTAPEMSYDVDFATTGTYHVWLRAWAPDARGKAMFVGLDGAPASAGIAAGGSGSWNDGVGEWSWSNTGRTGESVTVEVTDPGIHTIQVWMGDDGVIVDKVVLTIDAGFVPEEEGPPESPRSTDAAAMVGVRSDSVIIGAAPHPPIL